MYGQAANLMGLFGGAGMGGAGAGIAGTDPAEIMRLQREAQQQYQMANMLRQIGGANSKNWGDVIATLIAGYKANKAQGKADDNIAQAIERGLAYEQEQARAKAYAEQQAEARRVQQGRDEYLWKKKVDQGFAEPKTPDEIGLFLQDPDAHRKLMESRAAGKGPGVTVNTGDSVSPFQKELAKINAGDFAGMRSDAMGAQQNLSTLGTLEEIMGRFETGKIEEAKAIAGQYFGAEAAADMQAFNAIVGDLVMQELNAMKGPATEKEREYLQQLMVKAGNDPRANTEILNFLKRKNQGRLSLYQAADEFVRQNGTLNGFTPPSIAPTIRIPQAESAQDVDDNDLVRMYLR